MSLTTESYAAWSMKPASGEKAPTVRSSTSHAPRSDSSTVRVAPAFALAAASPVSMRSTRAPPWGVWSAVGGAAAALGGGGRVGPASGAGARSARGPGAACAPRLPGTARQHSSLVAAGTVARAESAAASAGPLPARPGAGGAPTLSFSRIAPHLADIWTARSARPDRAAARAAATRPAGAAGASARRAAARARRAPGAVARATATVARRATVIVQGGGGAGEARCGC